MRLVDADWILAHIKPYEPMDEDWAVTGGTAIRLIKNAVNNAPTVDAVPVVRCRECKNWVNEWWCRKYPNFRIINPDWYCASGERKGRDE